MWVIIENSSKASTQTHGDIVRGLFFFFIFHHCPDWCEQYAIGGGGNGSGGTRARGVAGGGGEFDPFEPKSVGAPTGSPLRVVENRFTTAIFRLPCPLTISLSISRYPPGCARRLTKRSELACCVVRARRGGNTSSIGKRPHHPAGAIRQTRSTTARTSPPPCRESGPESRGHRPPPHPAHCGHNAGTKLYYIVVRSCVYKTISFGRFTFAANIRYRRAGECGTLELERPAAKSAARPNPSVPK